MQKSTFLKDVIQAFKYEDDNEVWHRYKPVTVTETESSYIRRGKHSPWDIPVVLANQTNGIFWVIQENSELYWLVPKPLLKVSPSNYQLINLLYKCDGCNSTSSILLEVVRPARVVFLPETGEYEQAELGILRPIYQDDKKAEWAVNLNLLSRLDSVEQYLYCHLASEVSRQTTYQLDELLENKVNSMGHHLRKSMIEELKQIVRNDLSQIVSSELNHIVEANFGLLQKYLEDKFDRIDKLEPAINQKLFSLIGSQKNLLERTKLLYLQLLELQGRDTLQENTDPFSSLREHSNYLWMLQEYNADRLKNLKDAISVSETSTSMAYRAKAGVVQFDFKPSQAGLFRILELTDGNYCLAPSSQNISNNQYLENIGKIFTCHNYHPDYTKVILIHPAIIEKASEDGSEVYRLVGKGELHFE